jgi:aerobic-type carbon monoxide dehydrogenase small subunit (CoxS/CutS family)
MMQLERLKRSINGMKSQTFDAIVGQRQLTVTTMKEKLGVIEINKLSNHAECHVSEVAVDAFFSRHDGNIT